MFALQSGDQGRRFLETRDLVASHVASLVEADPGLIGKQFGPYRVLALLGHGGMGSVWLAERVDGLFTRQVALKLVHPALKSRVMSERFAREREILASLNHPNIARLLDAGFAEDGQSYLALDYVAGTPLTTYCDEPRLSVRERLELFRQVLSAVQYAHAHLVIHRDLKPANILVTEEGQVQLLDFGIAKLLSEGEAKETELTQLGGRALTPDYAAPEQIAGAPITTAADVYALGVMLYELLTGERPYKLKRDSRGALEEAILEADPVAPSRTALQQAAAAARATTAKKLSSTLAGRSRHDRHQGAEEVPGRALCDGERIRRGYRALSARRCGAGSTGQRRLPHAQVCAPPLGRDRRSGRAAAHPRRRAGRDDLRGEDRGRAARRAAAAGRRASSSVSAADRGRRPTSQGLGCGGCAGHHPRGAHES